MSDDLGGVKNITNKERAPPPKKPPAAKPPPKKTPDPSQIISVPEPEPKPQPEPEQDEPDRKIKALRKAMETRDARINELSKPLDRHIVNLYETFGKTLDPDRSARIERKFRQITMMPAEELEQVVLKRKHIEKRRLILKREKKKQMESKALKMRNRQNQNLLDFLFCRLANNMADQILQNNHKTIMPESFKRLYDCALANVWRTTGIDATCDDFDIKVCKEIARLLAKYVNDVLFETALQDNKYKTIKEMN